MKKILSFILTMACGATVVSGQEQASAPVMFLDQQDSTSYVAHQVIDKDRLVGAATVITGEQLRNSFSPNVQTALSGLSLGFHSSGWNIRSTDSPLIVIDGMRNREMSSITVEEVEYVYVLRDITAKMLYGSEAANGVIMIQTKRGSKTEPYIRVSGEYGRQFVNTTPNYLDSYQYAQAYNQAMTNDGYSSTDLLYSAADIEGYRKVVAGEEGADAIAYPNNDMYDIFMKNYRDYYRANFEMSGTEKNTSYFLDFGYYGDKNLQSVGEEVEFNRVNFRSNLDYKVNDVLSVYMDGAARWDITNYPVLTNSEYITYLSSTRPNDYPMFVGQWGDTDSLGKGDDDTANLYGELTRRGYTNQVDVYAQTNLGLNFDFNKWVPGLTGRFGATYDVYTTVSRGIDLTYYRYELQDDGSLLQVDGPDETAGSESKVDDDIIRNFGAAGQLNYVRNIGKHSILANATYDLQVMSTLLYDDEVEGMQDLKSITGGLRVNYAYDNKYVVEVDAALMGSDKFMPDKRWGLFGSAGAAWNIHKEDFMKDVNFVNKLKLKASYGKMGYDSGYDYMVYESLYTNSGSFIRGNLGTASWAPGYVVSTIGNTEFTYEVAEELNIGIEANLFGNRLMLEANYFDENRTGIPTEVSSLFPGYLGYNSVYPTVNYNATQTEGFELGISYGEKVGDFSYRLGLNMLYHETVYTQYEQTTQVYDHQYIVGRTTDAMTGYISDGLYQNQAEIDAYGVTSSFATLQPGDIKYIDYTGDGIINSYDQVVLGNSTPRYTYNMTLNAAYKNFSLYVLGEAVSGYDKTLIWNSLFQSVGTTKYSNIVLGAAVMDPVTGNIQSDASYPRLTSSTSGHSYGKNSNYWMVDGSYFRLKSAQVTYSFSENIASKIKAKKLELFAKGENLFIISAVKDIADEVGMDEGDWYAGLTYNPVLTSVALGLNIVF